MHKSLGRHIRHFAVGLGLLAASASGLAAQTDSYRIAAPPEIATGVLQDILASYGKASPVDLVRTVSATGEVAFEVTNGQSAPLNWTIQAGPSRAIFSALLGGHIDFGLVAGDISDQDRGAFRGRDLGDLSSALNFRALAIDGSVAIVNTDNALGEIGDELLARVLVGQVGNWADLGGKGGAITVFLSRQNPMAAQVLTRNGFDPAQDPMQATMFATDAEVVEAVKRTEGALGLVGQAAMRDTKALNLNDSCGNPIAQDAFALKSGSYPYSRAINAVRATPVKSASANGFWDYLGDPALAPVLRYSGLASTEIETRALEDMGGRLVSAVSAPQTEVTLPRLRSLLTILQGSEQLSTVIRFRPGRREIDAHNMAALNNARQYLMDRSASLSEIVVAGFTDNIGTAESNEEKSLAAANAVLEQLLSGSEGAFSRMVLTAHGFGEIAPLACNDHEANRVINRRVEIWVR